ncbi:PKD domain-containing protein [Chitinophagaceae bacterium 26-R-25]|nr:PKD domain-containing protein [Chitinophagaceae bacterium 26-R-25]
MRSILLVALMTAYSFFAVSQTLTPHNITSAGHSNIGFYDFKPADYTTNPATKFPLIIPLHGNGEKGNGTTQLDAVFTSGIGYLVKHGASMRFNYPTNGVKGSFLVLLPQLDPIYGDWQPFYIDEMIKWAKGNLNVDTNRIFITGYSLGGGGTWVYPASSVLAASQVTAVIPVSGTGLSQGTACNIAQGGTAVWAIHTTDDDQVSVYNTQGVVNGVLGCNPKNPVFGWYPVGNHQIYDQKIYPDTTNRYSYPTVYQYMLGMNKKNTKQNNQAPVANVGATDTTVVVNSSMMFYKKRITAEFSTDPNDVIFHYNWQITSNNLSKVWPFGGYQPIDTSTAWPAHDLDYKNFSWPWQDLEFHALGDYTFKLTVTDTYGATSTQTKTIHITNNGQNTAPVVDLGPDLTLAAGVTTASFIGTKVFDWEAQSMTYKVTQEAGPVTATLSANNWYQFNVSGMTAPGTYTFKVAATDAGGATGVDYVNVVVPGGTNNPPVAKITAPTGIILPVASITLDGSGSTDSDGSIAAYLWSQTAGPNTANIVTPTGKTTVVNGLVAGTYTFQLKVTDNLGATAVTSASVKVTAAVNAPPVAKITGTTTITLPTNSTTLDGSTSTDDGSITAYKWFQYGGGPNTAAIATPTGKSTVINGLIAGSYLFGLVVTDNQSAVDTANVTVVVKPAVSTNKPPVANAGSDFTTTNSYAYLSAGGSYDPDGTIEGYNWTQVSGPNTATILSGNTMFPTVQGLVSGTYVFRVTVTDNLGATDIDDVQLTVGGNKPPVADAGDDFTVNSVTTASLSASGSSDPDGSIASYKWTQVSGPNTATIVSSASVSTTVQGLIVGVYVFRVTVTDNLGATATDDVQVTVTNNTNNKPPVANAGNDFSTTNTYAYLSAGGSYDPDGSIAAYNWVQVSGPNTATILGGNTMFPTVQNLVSGVYVFKVTVTDNLGATASDNVQLTMGNGANKPPVANAGADIGVNGATTTSLNANGSSDPDGSITSYKWTQVSGPNTATIVSGTSVSTTVQGLVVGVYVFRVTVTDNLGATDTDDVQVTVSNNNNKSPIANAGNDFSTANNYAYLSAGASYDPDGSIAAFQWTQVSGPNTATILGGNTMFPTVQGLIKGTYVFRVQVTDNDGATATDDVAMTATGSVATGAVIAQSATGRDSAANPVQISIYPNPATTQITVSNTNNFVGNYKVIVYDATGKVEAQYNFVKSAAGLVKQQLDISRLPIGIHYVETIYDGNQHSTIQKFMKQ